MVALAPPDAFIVGGLTTHDGFDTVPPTDGVTVHPNVIGPTNPLPVTIVIDADDVPPGGTASGDRFGLTVIVKSAAEACGSVTTNAANRHKAAMPARPDHNFTLDSDHKDLNMSRVGFSTLRFLGPQKSCPPRRETFTAIAEISLRRANSVRQSPFILP